MSKEISDTSLKCGVRSYCQPNTGNCASPKLLPLKLITPPMPAPTYRLTLSWLGQSKNQRNRPPRCAESTSPTVRSKRNDKVACSVKKNSGSIEKSKDGP